MFPNMYRTPPAIGQNHQPALPAVALERIRRGMQTPAVQAALDPLQMQSTAAPPGLGNHHLATNRPRSRTITAPSVASVATLARRGAGGGIGITRFLTTPNINPATSLPATGATVLLNMLIQSVQRLPFSHCNRTKWTRRVQIMQHKVTNHFPTMFHSLNTIEEQHTYLQGLAVDIHLDLPAPHSLPHQVVDGSLRQYCW